MSEARSGDVRQQLQQTIEHLEHILPGQAPIRDFVHHNTLHGYQQLHFREAVARSRRATGAVGYMSREAFRKAFQRGRVLAEDLEAALASEPALGVEEPLFDLGSGALKRREVYVAALLHPLHGVSACQLSWQQEELEALSRFQPDVPEGARQRLLESQGGNEAGAIAELWEACLELLGLEHYLRHPEELVELTPELNERLLRELAEASEEERHFTSLLGRESASKLRVLLDRVGEEWTLRELLRALTGVDLMDEMRPYLARHLASWLDLGMSSWHHRDRSLGFYPAWMRSVQHNLAWVMEGLEEWRHHLDSLPEDPFDAIIEELRRLSLPRDRWGGYLERLALELPGWSGQVAWRSGRPGYHGEGHPIDLTDYLAVRLVMERIFALRLVAPMWRIEPGLDMLRWYLRHNPAEFLVRHATFNEELPEYLASRSQRLVEQASAEPLPAEQWLRLAELIHIWRQSVLRESGSGHTVSGSAWPLFRLAQHLGLGATALRAAGEKGARALLETLGRLDEEQAGYLRLLAYERRYREEALRALALNHGRGRWRTRPERPLAQVMTCMDDREEGLRRYLEELEPRIETLGAAGYFNLTMDWRGLDEKRVALCPVTQVPVNEIVERPREDQQSLGELRSKRLKLRRRVLDLVLQESRRGVLSAAGLIALAAPGAALSLAGKAMVPGSWGRFVRRLRERWEPPVATRIRVNGVEGGSEPTPEHPREGFTREEQIHRVSAFLRRNGFTRDFAPLVVMMGHGSQSQNNPHLAAYGCGACSGRFSGPNGRTFAAIVNQPEVRAELLQQGIDIPPDTWFIGAEHNTCDDSIAWYDLDLIPDVLREPFKALRQVMEEACRLHAAERSRRFASAPRQMTPEQALAHVRARMHDFSQVRPELGHACVALGVVGRRAVTRGLFLDRRAFLISYDPSQDAQGELLEEVLLEVAPVGAGIALEYYFSSVDNENYGCGSKVTHNVTGLFAVMEGSASDLRTGLPKQMIEIHEPMRLLLVVEAAPEVITSIVERQPPLQQLILNEWVTVASVHPDTGAVALFDPQQGFVPWQCNLSPSLPEVASSREWVRGMDPLPVAHVRSANAGGAHG